MSRLNAYELSAQKKMMKRLSRLGPLAARTDALFERAIQCMADDPKDGPATKVGLILAARIANDLRVCSIVSRVGYGVQALAQTASLIEVVGALSYVGHSDERAVECSQHNDRTKSYPRRVVIGIDATMTALGITDPAGRKAWQNVYQFMCMAKHANPRVSLQQGLEMLAFGPYFVCGPDTTPDGVFFSAYALYHAIDFCSAAICIAVEHCSDPSLRDQVRSEAIKVHEDLWGLESWLVQLHSAVD